MKSFPQLNNMAKNVRKNCVDWGIYQFSVMSLVWAHGEVSVE